MKLTHHWPWPFWFKKPILVISSLHHQVANNSSTAQGGGGSFKNRKPIGAVGCCESQKAERSHEWTERCLRSPLFLSLSLSFSDYLPTYLPTYLSIYLSISLSLSLCLSVCLSIFLPVYLQAWKRSYSARSPQVLNLTTDNIKNVAILRGFLNVWTWQRQKRSNSARLLHFSMLTTSKT